jgi:hypothetical protein
MMASLAVVVPVVFLAALAARTAPPRMDPVPQGSAQRPPADGPDWLALEPALPARIRYRRDATRFFLDWFPAKDLQRPDALLYWSRLVPVGVSTLPADAVLLGAVAGSQPRSFGVSEDVATTSGFLLLYSLGHGENLGHAPIPAAADARGD